MQNLHCDAFTDPFPHIVLHDFYDDEEFPNVMDVVNHFNSAVQHYRKQEWDRAIAAFNRALEFNPRDNLCKTYLERCNILKSDPPGEEWNGVWIMKTK